MMRLTFITDGKIILPHAMNAPNRNQVHELLLSTLKDFLKDKGPIQITEYTDPIKDLGLDSEDGVDFACVISEKFGCHVPNDLNPFVDDARHCGRRIGEVVDLVCNLIEKESS
jgi:acyl carrier protein